MNNSTRRNFLKSATILSISIIASENVFASVGNRSVLLGRSRKALTASGEVTDFLSELFGKPVTSSVDEFGNWVISIDGGAPIPLSFNLAEIVVTSSGKVLKKSDGSQLYGGPGGWAPSGVQSLFGGGSPSLGSIPYAPYVPASTKSKVGEGPDGTSFRDAVGLMLTSMGMAVSQATISANAIKLEDAAKFTRLGKVFAGIDLLGNFIELAVDDQTIAQRWEDRGQIVLGLLLLTPIGIPATIGVGILLTAWELWEYKRDHDDKG